MKRKAVAAVLTAVMVASMFTDVEVIMEAARQRVLLQHPQHPQQTTPWMRTEK